MANKNFKFEILNFKFRAGQSLVELLIAIGLLAVLLPAILTGLISSREGKAQQQQRSQATALLKESQEAVRSIREKGWGNLTDDTYHPVVSGSSWSLVAGSENILGFTRQVVISAAQRNSSGMIVDTGGTVDHSSKKIVASVSWDSPLSSKVETVSYLSRHLGNTTWVQDTQAQFNTGTTTNTLVSNAGGKVELATVPGGNWNNPQIVATRDFSGAQDANDVFVVNNRAYIVTVSRTGADFLIYDITTPSNPTLLGSRDLAATGYAVVVSGNYAYVATNNTTRELTVL